MKRPFTLIIVTLILLSAPTSIAQSTKCDKTDTIQIKLNLSWAAKDITAALEKAQEIVVCNGKQDVEWVVEGATDLAIQVWPSIYELKNLPTKKACKKCDPEKRGKIAPDAIEYHDISDAAGVLLAKRATLSKLKHDKGGWIYYQIVYRNASGDLITHDPFVIIQP